eukprot:465489-Pleurochrysis_carterae.AAC.1
MQTSERKIRLGWVLISLHASFERFACKITVPPAAIQSDMPWLECKREQRLRRLTRMRVSA